MASSGQIEAEAKSGSWILKSDFFIFTMELSFETFPCKIYNQ